MTFENEVTVHLAPTVTFRLQVTDWLQISESTCNLATPCFYFLFPIKVTGYSYIRGVIDNTKIGVKYTYKGKNRVKSNKVGRIGKNCNLQPLGFSA